MSHAIFPDIDPATYQRHALHSPERDWPETNCYLDVWIELLNAMGLPPEACLGSMITQDFEGDQFTFFKVPLEDLETLFGIRVTELAIYDRVENHVLEQLARGRLSLVEVDSYFLPDTQGFGYRQSHGKTTISVNRLDLAARRMDYFHGLSHYRVEGEDVDGIFQRGEHARELPFMPYTEFVKLPESFPDASQIAERAFNLLLHHMARRPVANPVKAFAGVLPQQTSQLFDKPFEAFHLYAFNTLRQMGANFELFSTHLEWLTSEGRVGFTEAASHARQISKTCKTAQFQLARAVTRKKTDKLETVLETAVEAWDNLVQTLDQALKSQPPAAS